jgi:hypothetical protein
MFGTGNNSFIQYEDHKDYNLHRLTLQTRSRLLYRGSKCSNPMQTSHNQLISWKRGKGCIRRKGLRGMLRPKLRKDAKLGLERGRDFGKSFLILLLGIEMRPQDLLLYEKNMVIRFGDGLQWVKWLGNLQ